jgi:hypothetical protein
MTKTLASLRFVSSCVSNCIFAAEFPAASVSLRCSVRYSSVSPDSRGKQSSIKHGALAQTFLSTVSDLLLASSLINKTGLHTLLYLDSRLSRRQQLRFT